MMETVLCKSQNDLKWNDNKKKKKKMTTENCQKTRTSISEGNAPPTFKLFLDQVAEHNLDLSSQI